MGHILYENMGRVPMILLGLATVLLSGFLVTRLSKKLRLPNVSGYIVAGILIGPQVLGLVSPEFVAGMDFVSDVALACIAFGVGKFFKKEVLRATGAGVAVITLLEALTAGLAVTLTMRFLFDTSWVFSVLIGAIATATAPASTIMTIKQYRAKGRFVDTLLQVVALDDVVALLAFGVASAVAQASETGGANWRCALLPVLYNLLAIALGAGCALLLKVLLNEKRSKDNRLILVVAVLLAISGVCSALDVSPLLACMVLGAGYVNLTGDERIFEQMDNFTPPILSCFFVYSGMRLDIAALAVSGIMGVVYFFVRIAGKYAGACAGSALVRENREIRNYLGIALVPQAGVSIGLAFLGQRLLPPAMGDLLVTIILSSSILYELVGPACAKLSLVLAGAIPREGHKKERRAEKETKVLPTG